MPAPRQLPDNEELRRLVSIEKLNYKQIAERFGVGEQAVYRAMDRMNATTPRPDYSDLIPWRISTMHQKAMPLRHLRAMARKERGLSVDEGDERRLSAWLDMLRENDLVVCYDPEYPSNEASPKGGFYYEKRKPSDEDYLVRPPA
jgi:hypothetical protein